MAVSTIALYASPPTGVCSASHQIASYDFLDVNGRSSAAGPSSSTSSSAIGGLSCLLSSSPSTIRSSNFSDEFTSLRSDEYSLGSSFRYSSSLKRDNLVNQSSPLSVLQGFGGGSSIGSVCSRVSGDFSSSRSGFLTHALGVGAMCVGYDSDSPACVGVAGGFEDELTFDMEAASGAGDVDLPPYAKDLLAEAQSRHGVFSDETVVKAFCAAEKAHRGQNRASGHPYLQHCVETAALLADIGANSMVVAAGLLHDTLDDCSISYGDIHGMFGAGLADLIEGVSKLSHLSKLARENNTASKTDEADRLHTMFLAMADARAVLIKLADRLHNMLTLDALPLMKQQRIAKETLEIFVPLANRLGIFTWKEQLENLCFKYLYPDQHRELSKLVNSYDDSVVTSSLKKLELALKESRVHYSCVSGRHKSPYSIYSKMLKKKLDMDEIHDIRGLRLIVEREEDCYEALAVVRRLWDEVPGRFKDYVIRPKFNGYQSLHTVVAAGEGMAPLEVQIRTKEMHLQAEYGFAAHWRYKEGECKHSSFVLQMVEWARWVISWQCEAMSKDKASVGLVDSPKPKCTFPTHSEDCTFSCKPNCCSDEPVFVIMIDNDKMSVQEFPVDSTVMDLLEAAGRGSSRWFSYGFPRKEGLRPRLNHEPVSDPTCKLKMGDVVELTPAIPYKSLTSYREEIQRMYDRGLTSSKSKTGPLSANSVAAAAASGFRS